MGGAPPSSAVADIQKAATGGLFFIFLLVIVFPHVIPPQLTAIAETRLGQAGFVLGIFVITYFIGPLAGLFAALVFLFVWSLSGMPVTKPAANPEVQPPVEEGFQTYRPAVVIESGMKGGIVPNKHKWFVEKVLDERPFIITEKSVATSAVQDNSDRPMRNSHTSR